jgi:hypothetical protein
MKRLAYAIGFLTLVGTAGAVHGETVRVVTRENAIRSDCRFLAPVRAKVRYDDPLTVAKKEGDWYRVTAKGVSGCIHKSAVAEKSYAYNGGSGQGRGGTSADEVALAGKGFNPEVESSYRSQNPQLDFAAVDAIQRYQVTEEDLKRFIEKGGLNLP